MKAEVESIGLSVKLHYGVKEDLLFLGGFGSSDDLYLNEWALGTKRDILDTVLKLLTTVGEDDVLVIGVVPHQRPSDEPVEAEKPPLAPSTLGYD